jgi:BirA family biotin operon repressor/biotin-[acetyl-CoA-carboxylase] ligase
MSFMKKINQNIYKIMERLRDGQYHDGNSIGEELCMTRAAVWKTIKKMLDLTIPVISMKGKGYALKEPIILLDAAKIQTQIPLHILGTIDSTNDYLKKFKKNKTPLIAISEHQSKGKGRLNRTWHSPFGQNIYLSCLYHFQKDISELAGLSLLVSLSVVNTLKKFGVKNGLTVKWSNDVMYEHKKLSGNLVEVQAETHDVSEVIIGIGLNVNMLQETDAEITQDWTSVRQILNKSIDRNELCSVLIATLLDYLQRFSEQGFGAFLEEWHSVDGLYNKMITLQNFNETITGCVQGINAQGHLLLQLPDGEVRAFSSGQTSIVKKSLV